MISVKATIDSFCPPFLQSLKSRVEGSPLGYRLLRGAFWSLVGSLISRGLGLLAGIAVARILGKHGYGQLGMVQNTAGMFGVFAGFGMGMTANKHIGELKIRDPIRAGHIIGLSSLVSWATGGLMALILVLTAPWLARKTLAAPEMGSLLQIGSLLLLLGGVNGAQTGALAGFEAFKTIARVNLITGLLAFPFTLLGAWWGGVVGSVWALVLNLLINCALNWFALREEAAKAGVVLSYNRCLQEWPVLWSFSLPAVLAGAVSSPIGWAASALLVNQADGYAQMGVYNAVQRIKAVPETMLTMLLAPLLPVLSEKFGAGDVRGYTKAAYSAFMLSLLATAPFALLQLGLPAITLLPYGQSYAGNHGLVRWMMLDLAVIGLFTPIGQMVASMSKMWFGFSYNLGFAATFAGLAFVLVPKYGAPGLAAAGTLAHLLCLWPCLLYIYKKERPFVCGLPMGKLALLLCGLASLIYFGARSLPTYGAATLTVLVIVSLMAVPFRTLLRSRLVRGEQASIR